MAKKNQPAGTDWDESESAAAPENSAGAGEAPEKPVAAATPAAGATAEPKPKLLPNNVRECFALLKELEKLPEHRPNLAREKAAKTAPIKAHIAKLQAGLPVHHIDAHAYGNAVAGQREILKRERWNHLARMFPEVKELLAERDALAKSLEIVKASEKK